MKLSKVLAAITIPTAAANFWMVYQRRYAQFGRAEVTSYGASLVSKIEQWTCGNDAFRHRIIQDYQDASEDVGVWFDPWNAQTGPLWHHPLVTVKIDLFSPELGRQTIFRNGYTDDGFTMVNAGNEVTARCREDRSFILDLDCWYRHPDPRVIQYHVNVNGSSMFFYESDIEVDGVRNEDTLRRIARDAGFWMA